MTHHGGMNTCRECGSADIVAIEMSMGDHKVTFIACHACDAKSWERDGQEVALDEVINPRVDR